MRAGVRPAGFDRGRRAGRSGPVRNVYALKAKPTIGGRYRLDALLHQGPHFQVWRATDIVNQSLAALKVLQSDIALPGAAGVLEREYQMASSLLHPNICRARDWVDTAECKAIVFDYLAGGDLVSLAGLATRHWLPAIRDIVGALGYLHDRGLVHRDVKARNVMFDRDDRAKLIDFGSAVVKGSPWRIDGTTVEHRKPGWVGQAHSDGDDVYALAALLHEMLHAAPPEHSAGRPRPAETATQTLAALVTRTLAAAPSDSNGRLGDYALVIESAIAQVFDK